MQKAVLARKYGDQNGVIVRTADGPEAAGTIMLQLFCDGHNMEMVFEIAQAETLADQMKAACQESRRQLT